MLGIAGGTTHFFGNAAEITEATASVARVVAKADDILTVPQLVDSVFGINATALSTVGTLNAYLGDG